MSQPIVAANWKMHGSRAFLARYLSELVSTGLPSGVRTLLFPPSVLLPEAVQLADAAIEIGIQTVHAEPEGAFTGEVSAELAADAGARWTLVGHSERRRFAGETDAEVAARIAAAGRAGLAAMLCIGEGLEARQAGRAAEVVLGQLRAVLDASPAALAAIAYEPVWAIGTGETATPEQAQEMHALIRAALGAQDERLGTLPILYGGSVKPDNAAALLAEPDIDGALVGGASLDPNDFRAIIRAAVE
ncbi:MAG: triose-phosphate isomerase [Pseudomonadales bacterium]|jgi:triosephosphate isomerase|nr:triose-phosphate isomerase [Pseudomonadales bacterium]